MPTTPNPEAQPAPIRFSLGQVVATPGALDLLDRTATNAADLLQRHQSGDWGSVPTEDADLNDYSVTHEGRLLSSYPLNDSERLWIITEWDRSVTTLLLPSEY
jgi:hypothetical protein